MIRPARPEDEAAIAALLEQKPESAMFLAANLARDMRGFWVAGDPVSDIVQLAPEGFFLTLAPGLGPDDWAQLRRRLRGQPCHGVNGRPALVAAALDGLDLGPHAATLDRVEPLFTLDLATLSLPEGPGRLRAMALADLPALAPWRAAYLTETMNHPPHDGLMRAATRQLEALIAAGRARVLEEDGAPLAITAFNAQLPDRVQVGGVYTPPELRGHGHARRAVALHLAEAKAAGATLAVLFAASPAAERAYRALGFVPDGGYRLVLYAPPAVLGR